MLAWQFSKWGGWSVLVFRDAFLLHLLLCIYNVAVRVRPGGIFCYLYPFRGEGLHKAKIQGWASWGMN